MKKTGLIFFLSIIFALIFAMGVLAADTTVMADDVEDITSNISSASDGDTLNITLMGDIEISSTLVIEKAITVNIDFNGYQIKYNGNGTKDTTSGAIHINNSGAVLNLKGSNPLEDYKTYTHYDDSKKADMIGTGNLLCVSFGKLNIENAYLYATNNTFVIYGAFVANADYCVKVSGSVLRVNEGSGVSAITYKGGNNHSTALVERKLVLDNCVEYGGFCGLDYNFNLTKGSEFTNVKFYDFYIKNDCWYDPNNTSTREKLMVNVDEALEITECIFKNYDDSLGNIKIYTETAKQNLRLYNCEYSALESGGKFQGDRAGTAYVYIIKKQPSCEDDGLMDYYANGLGESNKTADAVIEKGQHIYGTEETLTYPNGYANVGQGCVKCTICGGTAITDTVYEPIFVVLGYSVNADKDSFTFGIRVNRHMLDIYKTEEGNKLDFGLVLGNQNFEASVVDGEISVENGYLVSFADKATDYFDVKVCGFTEENKDLPVVAEFYTFDGENISHINNEGKEGISPMTFNEIADLLDAIKQKAEALLESKHKLYYNEDGSFRVLIIADAHMNVGGDATNVQEVKDRIKLLVDRENPNLVIFTGDNTISSSSEARLRENITALVSYIEEKQIPWCHVYGNHDHEGALSHAEQQKIHEEFEYCISKSTDGLSSVGNYVHGVYNRDGSLGSVIYLLNSNTYDTVNGGYDYIKDDQIAWYRESSLLLKEYNGGNAVEGMMAFHIPLIENNDAYNNRNNVSIVYEYTGDRNEGICASQTDTDLLETIFELGDVKAIVTGHDHVNDYMYNYKGVKLCSSPNVSDLTYYNANVQGGRVFDLNLKTIDSIPTYVSYIIERVDPNKYGVYDSNITLENFEGEKPETGVATLGGGTISGALTLDLAEGKGANGTNAIEVKRSQTGNAELYIHLSEDEYGRLGNNKYVIVWLDLTDVEFRKACIGLLSNAGTNPYMTDNDDKTNPPYYYLADGSTEWVSYTHGGDGCFGTGDGGGVKGKKGYFAFRTEDLLMGANGYAMDENSLVTGFYMYLDISSGDYANTPFYIDDIMLVEDYTQFE